MIEVKNLTKVYGEHKAIDDLSFTVENGQIFGFLGPNGAGKSTTMNIMTGYIAATSGTVKINGHDIVKEPEEAKKCIGYLPELPPVYQDMTVKEYLKFVAELKKVNKKEREAQLEQIMQQTKTLEVQDRLIKNLSKGYKQRVGLAQAIVGYPAVIILDEPTVGLDPLQIIEIRELIKELAKEHTIILSSHILSEISAVCDHIMIISKGKLVAIDTAEGLERNKQDNVKLEITVRGTKAALEEILAQFTEIQDVIYKEDVKDGTVEAEITMAKETDIRETLFYALAEAKMPIRRMELQEMGLEDIFLELTSEGGQEEQE